MQAFEQILYHVNESLYINIYTQRGMQFKNNIV